jgi:uncharacterized protein
VASQADLISAVQAGDAEKVKQYLRENPSLASAKDSSGVSGLMHALYRGLRDIADLLGEHRDLDIFEATSLGKSDKVTQILKRDPDSAKSWSADGFTPLHFAAFFNRPESARDLIRHGADVAAVAKNPMKVMPLHSAAAAHSAEIVRLLVENGASPNVPQEGGWLPLHEAAQIGDVEMVKTLLEYRADPKLRSNNGKTAADMAQEKGHTEIAKLLSQ